MGSKHKTLQDLFQHQLKDLYDAERHTGKIFGKMAKSAEDEALRAALEQRHDATQGRIDHLDAVFAAIDKKEHGLACEAMHGLIAETKALLDDFEDSPALDAGLLAAAQAIEHYGVARYAALRLWAGQLGLPAAAGPLGEGLASAQGALERWNGLASTLPVTAAAGDATTTTPMTLKQAALMGLA